MKKIREVQRRTHRMKTGTHEWNVSYEDDEEIAEARLRKQATMWGKSTALWDGKVRGKIRQESGEGGSERRVGAKPR